MFVTDFNPGESLSTTTTWCSDQLVGAGSEQHTQKTTCPIKI